MDSIATVGVSPKVDHLPPLVPPFLALWSLCVLTSSVTSPSNRGEHVSAYTRHIRHGKLDMPGEATDE